MNELIKKHLRDKRLNWMLLGIVVIISSCIYLVVDGSSNQNTFSDKDMQANKLADVTIAKNDSSYKEKSRIELQKTNLDTTRKITKDESLDNFLFPKVNDSQKESPVVANEEVVESKINPRSYESNQNVYDESTRERLAELEQIKKEEKLKRLIALKEKLARAKEDAKPKKLVLEKQEDQGLISTIDNDNSIGNGNSFHSMLSDERNKSIDKSINKEFSNFRAVIHANSTILNGGRAEIRLLEPLSIKGKIIPKGTIVYGLSNFSTERVKIKITSLQYQNIIYPIELTVYDMDGMEGIYVPNILEVQSAKQASAQGINSIQVPVSTSGTASIGTALGLSAINAGTQGAKGYANKKILQQKATLKSNYFIFLKP